MFSLFKKARETGGRRSVQSISTIIQGYVISHVGCRRENNEDNFYLAEKTNHASADYIEIHETVNDLACLGVFDGMGGVEAGEVASRIASECLADEVENLDINATQLQVETAVRKAFSVANNRIVDMSKNVGVCGTTGTVLFLLNGKWKVFHLGDSRLYYYHNRRLVQVTRDQTLAQMKIDCGFYGPDDPAAAKEKHQLTEFIGRDQTKNNIRPVEGTWETYDNDDVFLLCSDGLYDACSDHLLAERLNGMSDLTDIGKQMISDALEHGGPDNITCLLAKTQKRTTYSICKGESDLCGH